MDEQVGNTGIELGLGGQTDAGEEKKAGGNQMDPSMVLDSQIFQ